MKRPNVIVRKGGKFILDERKLYPHLKRQEDMVRTAANMACLHHAAKTSEYQGLSQEERLNKVNEVFYQFLIDWGIYKGKK